MNTYKVKPSINSVCEKSVMTPSPNRQKKGKRITETCAIPLPSGDENTTRLAMSYARAFSKALKGNQYVVLCNVSAPLAQATTLGAWIAGFPVAYLDPALSESQLEHALSKFETTLKIGCPNCLSRPEDKLGWLSPDADGGKSNNLPDWVQQHCGEAPFIPREWQEDECAAVIFTSGSTGMPKGVCHSIGNLSRSAQLFIQQFTIDSHDRLFNLAPIHTISGVRVSILVPLLTGCQLTQTQKVEDLEEILDILQDAKPTVVISGPHLIRQIALLVDKLDEELTSVRAFLSTGAKLDPRSRARIWEGRRIPVLNYYGLTETAGITIADKMDPYNPECTSLGKECPGVTVELTEVEGDSDPTGKMGQLRIYSPNLFLGYLGESLARKNYIDTGDLGMRDGAGNIILKGRLDQGVKASNTLWIFPQAVEQLLVIRSDVAEVHVWSEYDQYDRGVLRAKVVPASPESADASWLASLGRDIEDQLGPDYRATDIEVVSAIPRTALGKIIKDSC